MHAIGTAIFDAIVRHHGTGRLRGPLNDIVLAIPGRENAAHFSSLP
jgi:hypothetical protein